MEEKKVVVGKIEEDEIASVEKIATDFTSDYFKTVYRKNAMQVDGTRDSMTENSFKRLRVYALLPNCTPEEVFMAINDFEYSKNFDTACEVCMNLEQLDENRYISYYRTKIPSLINLVVSKRDFLTQRFYKKYSDDKFIIFNRDVPYHPKCPTSPKTIRANVKSLLYWIVRDEKNPKNSKLIYMASVDLKGKISQAVNHWVTKLLAPNMVKKLRKSCIRYKVYREEQLKKGIQPDWFVHKLPKKKEEIKLPLLDKDSNEIKKEVEKVEIKKSVEEKVEDNKDNK